MKIITECITKITMRELFPSDDTSAIKALLNNHISK